MGISDVCRGIKIDWLGHDKMILYLATAYTSVFNTMHQDLLNLISGWSFLVIREFLPQNFFGNFLFDSPSFNLFNCAIWEPLIS